jgi:hypothetical protein
MELLSLGQVIAERRFSVSGDGAEVVVQLGAPSFEDSTGCYCPWRILGLGSERIRFSAGVDGFQALQLAMPMIGVTLKCRAEEAGVELFWSGEGYGLPTD